PEPAPDAPALQRSLRTPTEQALARLWSELLQQPCEDGAANFFALGGHSLSALRLAARVRQTLGKELALTALFQQPVLHGLAAQLDRQAPVDLAPIVARAPGQSPLPLSDAQARVWFSSQLEPDSPAYHLGGALRLEGELDLSALRGALEQIVSRHEALRAR